MTAYRRDDLPPAPLVSASRSRDRMIQQSLAAGQETRQPPAGERRKDAVPRLISASAARDEMIRRTLR